MFFALFSLGAAEAALKPLLLMPGLYGSQLWATHAEGWTDKWYCPKKMDDDLLWMDAKFVLPSVHNCLFDLIGCAWDKTKKAVTSKPGVNISVHDFGGFKGIDKIVSVLGLELMESFDEAQKQMKKKGYVVGENLFGVPYDWRLGLNGLIKSTPFLKDFKALVEKAYTQNDNTKVTIVGYSMGGLVTSHVLGRVVDPLWRMKYIEKVIFLCPAFSGSGETLPVAWTHLFPLMKSWDSESVTSAIESMGVLSALFPNYWAFLGETIIKTPEGKKIGPEGVINYFIEQGKITSADAKNIVRANEEFLSQPPEWPGVPFAILYNSGIDSPVGLDLTTGDLEKDPGTIYGPGDGTVPSKGIEWACKMWPGTKQCIDVAESDKSFNHAKMSTNKYTWEQIYDLTNGDWYKSSMSKFITAPHITVDPETGDYTIDSAVRPEAAKIL